MIYIAEQGAPGSQRGGEALTGRTLAVAYSAASQLAVHGMPRQKNTNWAHRKMK